MTRAGYNKIKAEIDVLRKREDARDRKADRRRPGRRRPQRKRRVPRRPRVAGPAAWPRSTCSKTSWPTPRSWTTPSCRRTRLSFGCTIVVKDLDFGDTEEFTLVGAGEEDYDTGQINIASPLAQGIRRQEGGRQGRGRSARGDEQVRDSGNQIRRGVSSMHRRRDEFGS